MARSKIPLGIALLGLTGLCIALALPSIEVVVFGAWTPFRGWQAFAWAVALGLNVVKTNSYLIENHPAFLVDGFAAIFNLLLFVLVPGALASGRRRYAQSNPLFLSVILGLLLGVIAPLVTTGLELKMMLGYFVWLFGLAMLFLSLVMTRFTEEFRIADQANV